MSSSKVEFNPDEPCVVCFKKVRYYSIGSCDHPVCYECCTRMRVLCQANECPICRQDMQKVIFTDNVRPYKTLEALELHLCDRKYKIWFDGNHIKNAFNTLLQHKCPVCSQVFSIFKSLDEHVSREHKKFFCDLCVKNLKIFSSERRCYDRSQLSTHRRVGDTNDKSHKGHPLCEFCDVRYMDSDELYRHLRRDHFFCHFCDADGHHYYFNEYPDLKQHFLKEHFLCEEENCVNEQFTSVFRTEIDLKAHVATTHGRTLGKHATKQAKKLELELNFPSRSNQRGGGRGNNDGSRYQHGEPARYQDPQPPTPININSEEFPTLGGQAPVLPVQPTRRKQPQEAFPALGPVDISTTSNSGGERWTAPSNKSRSTAPPTTSRTATPSSAAADFPSLPSTSTVPSTSTNNISWNSVTKTKKPAQPSPSKQEPVKKPSKTVLSIAKNVQNRSNAVNQARPTSQQRSKAPTSSRDRYKDDDDDDDDFDYNRYDDDISRYGLNSRVLPPQGYSKVQLIKAPPPTTNTTASSQNNMNYANIQQSSLEASNGSSSNSKKVKMKGSRLKAEDFPLLDAAPRVAPVPAARSTGPGPGGFEYILPVNFPARNASLFENIQRHIGSAFDEFKTMSSLYMRQGLNADEYYTFCLSTLGRNAFNEIFPELLLLLPMIERQKDLWKVHHSNPSAKNRKVVAKLDQCAVCGQVITIAELKHHLDAHKRVGVTGPGPSGGGPKVKKTPSAWGK
ncbi:hypothetical protein M8J77_020695 [Diaphorina citri]|nr:hypothetical protein M8J77_020695 [Diaphorina citri]